MYHSKQNILIGRTILGLKIAEDKEALLFVTDAGEIKVRCDGDCCSYSWVESIELPAMGFPAVVISAEDVDMPDLGDMEDRDVVSYYGFKIETDKGVLLIDYRNDSNGYYGGDLVWPDEYYYGGVYGQNVSDEVWIDVPDSSLG